MKKFFVILLALCLVFAGVIGYLNVKSPASQSSAVSEAAGQTEPSVSAAPAETAPEAVEAEPLSLKTVDLEALRALHAPDEVVATVDGREETWSTYYYLLSRQAASIDNYFATMAAYYGMALNWDDVAEGDDTTYAQIAVGSAEDTLLQFATIEGFAEANGLSLDEMSLEAQRLSDMKTVYAMSGEDPESADRAALEAAFAAYLEEQHMSPEMYDRINRINLLYQDSFTQLYGENGEKLSDEAALAWLNENGYLCADHILLATQDLTTGEALDEAAIGEKRALAEQLAAELRAIEDPVELLARLAELKETYSDDSGKASKPDGYTFTSGVMAGEFEEAARALAEYQVSDPVETAYGFHILLRLPLTADAALTGGSGDGLTGRQAAANAEYGQRLQDYMDALSLQYAEGFTAPDLLAYLKDAES